MNDLVPLDPNPSHRVPRADSGQTPIRRSRPASAPETPKHRRAGRACLTLEVISAAQDFEALESEWNRLFAESALPHHHFLSFAWNWHWHEHYVRAPGSGFNGELCLVTGRANDRLVLIWPLARETRFGFTQLTFMGDPVTQYGDVLVEDGTLTNLWLKQAYDFVCRSLNSDAVFLRKVRADSNIAPLLRAEGVSVTAELEAPYIDLTRFETYEDYFTTFGKRARKNRRRHRRRMEEEGKITYTFHKSGARAGEIAAEAVALKRLWLKTKGLFSRAYATKAIDAFFQAACTSTERPVGAHITKWDVDGRTGSIELALEHGGAHIAHIGVYHPEFERHSPGTLQMEDTIRSCIDRGLSCYDLMAPADSYKLQWCDRTVEVCDYALPASPLGQLYVAVYLRGVRQTGKKVLAALPDGPRHLLASMGARLLGRRG